MSNIISIKDLCFSYDENKIFNNLNLDIKDKKWLTIIGPTGSGKTTLSKIISGDLDYTGKIELMKNKVGVIYPIIDEKYLFEKVDNQLDLYKKEMKISSDEFKKNKDEIIEYFNLKEILQSKISELSYSTQILVNIVSVLLYEPEILILDGILTSLDYSQRKNLIKLLKKKNKDGMVIINITKNIEDALLGDDILLLSDGNIEFYDDKKKFFANDEIIKKNDIKLPFIVELSQKLKYYDMIEDTYFKMEDMVDAIWK